MRQGVYNVSEDTNVMMNETQVTYCISRHDCYVKTKLTLAHCMWLQPSFFCIGDLQLAQGLAFESNHKQLAASS